MHIRSYQNKCYFGYEHSYYSVFNCVYALLKVADYVAKILVFVAGFFCSWLFPAFILHFITSYSCQNTLENP